LIADDQAHVRKGLELLLELQDDLEVVGTAANGLEAVELAEHLRPDVILMDLSMPHLDGFEAARRIRDKGLPASIIVMSAPGDPVSRQRAEQAGVVALIEKGDAEPRFGRVIRSAYRARVPPG